SNIGGLVGLWFGFCFIDASALIRLLISNLKYFILLYLNSKVVHSFQNILLIFSTLIVKLEKFNLRKIRIMLTIPVIICQIYALTDNYLQYKTQTSIEMVDYRGD